MAFLPQGAVERFKNNLKDNPFISCWEQLGCTETGCPVYKRRDLLCWRTFHTECRRHSREKKIRKWEQCLLCPVFKRYAEADERGWQAFVCEETGSFLENEAERFTSSKEGDLLAILDNLPDGLFIMNKTGKIIYFNAAAESITGLSTSDAIGMHCRDIFKETTCETGSGQNSSNASSKLVGKVYNREFTVTRLDGKQVSIISSISVLKDRNGKVIGGVQVFKDISDRKRLEDDLRLSESKYRRIFEGSKDMIFLASRNGLLRDVNQAAVDLLGYPSKQELLSLDSIEKIYHNPMHWKVFKNQIDRYGFVKDFEAGFKRKDGIRIHCLLSGNAIKGTDGEIKGYEGIVKDITARMDAVRNLQKRHRELSLLNAVALSMNATQDLEEILMTALKKVLEVLNVTAGGIYLVDPEQSCFSLSVGLGLPKWAFGGSCELTFHDRILMRSLLEKGLFLTPKPNFPPFRVTLRDVGSDATVTLTSFLITAKDKASGFLALDLPPKMQLSEQDQHLLGSLGNFLGGAIENNRLLRTVHQHREELKRLTAKLFQSQELERRRIARELHDEAGQALTAINFTLDTIEKDLRPDVKQIKGLVSEIRKQINRTYDEMRRISYSLHPALLSDLGLEPALDSYLKRICEHCELDIDFKMVGFDNRVSPEIEITLYRLSQEALTNTIKHSQAGHFRLSIIKSYPHIIFLAEDDGIGFDSEKLDRHKDALGLLSMRERASMLGGNFFLRTSSGKGTRIRIEIPIDQDG